ALTTKAPIVSGLDNLVSQYAMDKYNKLSLEDGFKQIDTRSLDNASAVEVRDASYERTKTPLVFRLGNDGSLVVDAEYQGSYNGKKFRVVRSYAVVDPNKRKQLIHNLGAQVTGNPVSDLAAGAFRVMSFVEANRSRLGAGVKSASGTSGYEQAIQSLITLPRQGKQASVKVDIFDAKTRGKVGYYDVYYDS
ncbi:MAG: hypothetical protein NZ576_12780, partial [Bacteroidia bacterium]|nr:hypothetical protein [Bacteroidia bacterium]